MSVPWSLARCSIPLRVLQPGAAVRCEGSVDIVQREELEITCGPGETPRPGWLSMPLLERLRRELRHPSGDTRTDLERAMCAS